MWFFVRKSRNLLLAVFFGLLFLYATALSSYAITIDGIDGRIEWAGSRNFCIIDNGDESNCDILYASVKTLVDDTDNRLFIMVICKTKEGAADVNLLGAEFYINDVDRIATFFEGSSNAFDPYYYSLESVFKYDEVTKVFCGEICLGIKFGVPETLLLGVRVFDCRGIPSNLYSVTIRSAGGGQNNGDEGGNEEGKTGSTTKPSTMTQTAKKTTTTKAPTTARTTTAPFTTVAYKPFDLFKSTSAVSASKSTTKKKNKTTSAKARFEKTSVKDKITESETKINDEQNEYSVAPPSIADGGPSDYGYAADDAVAAVNGELDSYKKTSRKKTIGIAAASALLSAAVIDVLVTSGHKRKKEAEAEIEEDTETET